MALKGNISSMKFTKKIFAAGAYDFPHISYHTQNLAYIKSIHNGYLKSIDLTSVEFKFLLERAKIPANMLAEWEPIKRKIRDLWYWM